MIPRGLDGVCNSLSESVVNPLTPRPSRARYVVVSAICLAAFVAYMGRNCLGVASEDVQRDLGIDEAQMGWVMSAFFWAYALAQVPAGWLAHRFGARMALTGYAAAWSSLSVLFYFVGDLPALIAVQAGFGVAQAGIFPSSAGMIRNWLPAANWGLAVGLMGGFMSIGAAAGSAITGYAIEGFQWGDWAVAAVGWREVLVGFAVPGFLFALWFGWWYRDQPEQHSRANDAECLLIRDGTSADDTSSSSAGWIHAAVQPSMWLLYGQQFCRAAGYIFFPTWFPQYLKETRGVSTSESGLLAALPLIAVVLASFVGGALIDWLLKRTGSLRISRQGTAVVAMASCAACIAGAYFIADVHAAVALISFGTFCGTLAGPPSSATTIQKGGNHTEQIYGVMNMTGNLGAAACPLAIGFLVKMTNNWNLVLLVFVAIYAVGAVCWLFLNPHASAETE